MRRGPPPALIQDGCSSHGAGAPINRPIAPLIPISRNTRNSPSLSTISAISGRSMLLVARNTASMNRRLA